MCEPAARQAGAREPRESVRRPRAPVEAAGLQTGEGSSEFFNSELLTIFKQNLPSLQSAWSLFSQGSVSCLDKNKVLGVTTESESLS